MKTGMFILFVLSNLSFASSTSSELDLICIRKTEDLERKVFVNLRPDSLQMTVKLDNGQTIRAAATETLDHASGRRHYYLENGGFPYFFEIRLILESAEDALSTLSLKKGAHPFQCRKSIRAELP